MEKTTKDIYLSAYNKYGVGNQELLDILGEDLFTSPATHLESLYNASEGGLMRHMLTVAKYCINFNMALPVEDRCSIETLMRVSFLAEIGRVGMYLKNTDTWSVNKLGKNYEYVEDKLPLRISQRSIMFIAKAGIKLTDDEFAAISNHDANSDDLMIKHHNTILGDLLKMGTTFAIKKEKQK